MKLDTSKLSNKDDLIVLLSLIILFTLFGLALYLAVNENSFLSGFLSATIIWQWKSWFYEPIDKLLEKHWPCEQKE
jgi:hypothetical protein